jgi:hypothetical protein
MFFNIKSASALSTLNDVRQYINKERKARHLPKFDNKYYRIHYNMH